MPCRVHAGAVRDRQSEFGDAEIAVVTHTRARNLRGFRARFVSPLTVLADETGDVYRSYGLDPVPSGGDFVIDPDGRLTLVRRSARSDDRPPVDALVSAIMGS